MKTLHLNEPFLSFKVLVRALLCALFGLAIALVAFPFSASPAYAASSNSKLLVFDQSLIDQVGKQDASSVACLCYAAAYCQTIVTGQPVSWTYFDGNGGAYGQNSAYGRNMSAEFNQITTGSDQNALELMYNAINEGHPCVIQAGTPNSYWHWVAVVGYEGVSGVGDLSIEKFLMLDPEHSASRTPVAMNGCWFLHDGGSLGDLRISWGSVATTDGGNNIVVPDDDYTDDVEFSDYTTHIYGDEAYQTAIEVSKATFKKGSCNSVILARSDAFQDSLSATGLAGALDCPILLVDRTQGVNAELRNEILRLGAQNVYIIGGKGAIPANIERQLYWLDVVRLYGEEACDTSVVCAKKISEISSASPSYSVVAMSDNFQDALSMSSFAYAYAAPIILETSASSGSRQLPAGALDILNSSTECVYVVGGTGAVPASSLTGISVSTERIAGYDGYDTSNEIAVTLTGEGLLSPSNVVVASGAEPLNGLDALAGCSYAGRTKSPILLTNGQIQQGVRDFTTIRGGDSEDTSSYLELFGGMVSKLTILGGSYVMPNGTVKIINDVWRS